MTFSVVTPSYKASRTRSRLVLTNGWNTECQLRFEVVEKDDDLRTWTVYEKSGSEQFQQLKQMEASNHGLSLIKKEHGVELQGNDSKLVTVKDCVLETRSLGDDVVYNLTFTPSGRDVPFVVYWDSKSTTFVGLETRKTTVPSKETTGATEPDDTDAPFRANKTLLRYSGTTSEPSTAVDLQLGLIIAAVIAMHLFVTTFLRA